ncbi:EAL domain-containing protein [Aquimonas voraii]|uniref:PAS domain S-box-containing protein/diguanylate cyclase (GGDEF) domain-containing protein n=1 Tax=Aquimonas voraii TaxID=265719 RepID=A0A1G6YJF5_9GAMM|nr:EAL domain-containing protein [Aquimonas voraii]SDD90480.1 PAS domain S-box-containing protein/diguanylate cyclase (GGDEF) domain-containing protein [Aquimonas voraii]
MGIEQRLRALLIRWPARLTLPVLMVCVCAALLLVMFQLRSAQALRDAREDLLVEISELTGQTARRLESYAELGEGNGRRAMITRLALYPEVREAWLFDDAGLALASLRRADTGLALSVIETRLGASERGLLRQLAGQASDEALSLVDASLRLQVEPVLTRSAPPAYGRVIVLADSGFEEARARWNALRLFRGEALILLLAAGLIWWLLRLQLLERSARLQVAAHSLYAGASPEASRVDGDDELGVIGRALDAGLERLNRHECVQRLALHGSRLLVEDRPLIERLQALCTLLVDSGGFAAARVLAADSPAQRLCEAGDVGHCEREAAHLRAWRFDLRGQTEERSTVPALLEVWGYAGEGEAEWLSALELLVRDLQMLIARQRAEQARRGAERRERLAMEAAELGAWQLELAPARLRLSTRGARMLGADPGEVGPIEGDAPGEPGASDSLHPAELLLALLHPEDAERLRERLRPGMPCPSLLDEEFRVRRGEGWAWLLGRGTVVERDAAGAPRALAGVLIDIDARKRAESALRLASEVFASSQLGILICDAEGRIIDVNQAFESITGFPRGEVLGQRPSLLASGHHSPDFYAAMWGALLDGGRWEGEVWNRRRDGTVYPQWLTITRIDDAEGRPLHYIGQFVETSDRKAFESRIEYLGAHDLLTGLPRRERLIEALDAELQAGLSKVALMHVDIDRFRQINESLGYATGDLVLRAVPTRMARELPAEAWMSRISADEFLVAVPAQSAEQALVLACRLQRALSEPIEVDARELSLGISIGLAIGPTDGASAEALAKSAELALGAAQLAGRNTVQAYREDLASRGLEALTLESQLRQGLQRQEFFLVFQPQIDLRSDALAGYEALVRWRHPQRGLVSPAEFIPLAEATGLIVPLGEFVLREACAAAMRLRERGLPAVPVSVNVSTLQFRREDFEATVEASLADSGLPAEALELELTESVLMDHAEAVLRRLDRLRARGLKLAIDDFGTGFSSLSYLGRLRPDRLKIDQSFVRGMGRSVTSQGVVKAILALAEEFGLATVAEGVETHEEAAVLRALGCDAGQGYLFARPQEEHLLRWPLAPAGQEQDRPTPTSP